jgi:hypothetical protein
MSSESAKLKREKLIGKKFGKLTVIGFKYEIKRKRYYVVCSCECGKETIVDQNKLKTGHTKSCGCNISEMLVYRNKTLLSKHNLTNHPMYVTWLGGYKRCNNDTDSNYKRYGGRGIKCEWTLEEACAWYDENPKPVGKYSLDRIDNNGNYCINNVRWATDLMQAVNKEHVKKSKNIYDTKSGKIRACISIKGVQYSKTFTVYKEAEQWIEELRNKRLDMYFND